MSRLSIIKLFELIITVTCLVLHYNSLENHSGESFSDHSVLLINGTFVGFTVILCALFAGYVINSPINKRLDFYFSAAGCAMFIASGIMIISYWHDSLTGKAHSFVGGSNTQNLGYAKGGLAIVNGILFAVDGFFTCRD